MSSATTSASGKRFESAPAPKPGPLPRVEHALRFEVSAVEPFEETRRHFGLQHRMRFVRVGGTRERVTHVARVEARAHAGNPSANSPIVAASDSAWPRNGAWPLLHST